MDRTMSLPETTMETTNPEMDEYDPFELQGTKISPEMKQQMVEHFGERKLPILTNTKATDRTAQAILDLDDQIDWAYCRRRRETISFWAELNVADRKIGEKGIQALARAACKGAERRKEGTKMNECNPWELRGTRISPKMKRQMVENLGKRSLPILTNTQVTGQGAQALLDIDRDVWDERRADVNWPSLVLSSTNIGDVGIKALARAYVKTTKPDPRLWLPGLKALDDETAVGLANALNTNPSWKNLWIQQCNFGYVTLEALASALSNNHIWQELVLLRTNLGDDGVEALAEVLQQNTQWTTLELWDVRFSSVDGAKALCEAFYSARSDVWSYVGLVEDFMYKGHRGNRHLNRHGYVMHPTRENQQVKNRSWERVPSPFHIDQTKIRTTKNQNPTKKNNNNKFYKTIAKT